MNEPALPWTGACRCGRVRFRVTRPPLLSSACHCSGCQKMSASAFSLTLTLSADGFELLEGETARGGLQTEHEHLYCAHCKSWMVTRPAGLDWVVNLRSTMLDDHAWVAPFVEVFTEEKLPWAATGAVHSYAQAPDMEEWQPLMEAYAARRTAGGSGGAA